MRTIPKPSRATAVRIRSYFLHPGVIAALAVSSVAFAVPAGRSSSQTPPAVTLHPVAGRADAAYPLAVDPPVWLEQKVVGSNRYQYDDFAAAAAVTGNAAAVGAPNGDIGNVAEGAAYVFTKANGAWDETQILTPTDGNYNWQFGSSISMSGDTMVVGAPDADGYLGAAYVFTESNGTWTEVQKLTASDGSGKALFGSAVAVNGNEILVGSPGNPGGTGTTAAYVFTETNGTWTQTAELAPPPNSGQFASAVALNGATALVGAYQTANKTGAAFVFTESGDVWNQTQVLTASDGAEGDRFGAAVALSGDTALIGAKAAAPAGAVYVFTDSGGTWTQVQKLTGSGDSGGAYFGQSVSLSGTTALIGAPLANVGANRDQGTAYLFTDIGGTWSRVQKLTASDGAVNYYFGYAVALDGDTSLVGATNANTGLGNIHGAAYFYGQTDLALAVDAPANVDLNSQYVSQAIVMNSATAASPAVAVTAAVPAGASFVSASASQGSCSHGGGSVSCDFGPIAGNGGTATANVTLTATGSVGSTIENTASIADSTPPAAATAASTVTTTDQAPVAQNGTLTLDWNSSAKGTLNASDPDGNPLTFSIVSQPQHGEVTLNNAAIGGYTYTPHDGYFGSDSFTFKASDGILDSNTAKVSITVKQTGTGGGGGATAPLSLGMLALAALTGLTRRRP